VGSILSNATIPIFSVIVLGYFLRKKEVITPQWIGPANTVTFYVAVPAVIFRAVARQETIIKLSAPVSLVILGSIGVALCVAYMVTLLAKIKGDTAATFVHSSVHGNIGYMAYAVAYYGLGKSGFQTAVFLSPLLLIAQNTVAVLIFALKERSGQTKILLKLFLTGICVNPIILAVVSGIIVSLFQIHIPVWLGQFIDILASMGLPTALLLIGSNLTFTNVGNDVTKLAAVGCIKLLLMPLTGVVLLHLLHLPADYAKPFAILLGAPTATVTYVMARQLGGDPVFASEAISIHTLACAVTYSISLAVL